MIHRVLLLVPSTSYRGRDFLAAARRLGVEVVVGSDHRHVLQAHAEGRTLALAFAPLGEGVSRILEHAHRFPLSAIVGTDDETSVLAAAASKVLGLRHNDPEAVATARDKYRFRQAMRRSRIRSPWFRLIDLRDNPSDIASRVGYPCVLKPLALSAGRGVIRVDDEAEFAAAARRIAAILETVEQAADARHRDSILCEGFIPGREVALEGLLDGGRLRPLAMFDKPDPLDGPYFEETIYVTPSRIGQARQREVVHEVERAAAAIELRHGPIHAELRVNEEGAWIVELAARSIGGLCSRALAFSPGLTLEEMILRQALGLPTHNFTREASAAGVMMIPIPNAGRLRRVLGLAAARAVPGIEDVTITTALGDLLVPLPEGNRYLGFLFAKASQPSEVEAALRHAHARLRFDVDEIAQAPSPCQGDGELRRRRQPSIGTRIFRGK